MKGRDAVMEVGEHSHLAECKRRNQNQSWLEAF